MRTRSSVLTFVVVAAIVTLFTYTKAGAVADGDGSCSPGELAAFECANFGPNVIEFRGTSTGTCMLNGSTGPFGSAPCTVYFYKYSGAATNQINVAIPEKFTKKLNDAVEVNCSQYITNGSGDSTTEFGIGLTSMGTCRIAPTGSSFQSFTLPINANFAIATDPSFIDSTTPLDWQVRQSKNDVYRASVVGPAAAVLQIASTGETLTTANGTTVSYAIVGGQVQATGATVLAPSQIIMCVPGTGTSLPGFFPPAGYVCDVVFFVDSDPNIQVGPNSICVKYIGRTPISYQC